MACSMSLRVNLMLQHLSHIHIFTKAIQFYWISLSLDHLIPIRICTKVSLAWSRFQEFRLTSKSGCRSTDWSAPSIEPVMMDRIHWASSKFFFDCIHVALLSQTSDLYRHLHTHTHAHTPWDLYKLFDVKLKVVSSNLASSELFFILLHVALNLTS